MRELHRAPPDILNRLEGGETLSPLEKLLFRERIDDLWKPYLTITEYSVISYIVRRTVHFGKTSFTASTENILNGAQDWPGVGVSRRTYFDTLNTLEAKGMIQRVRHKNGRVTVVINTEWTPEDQEMIPVPKRLKDQRQCPSCTEACSRDELGREISAPYAPTGAANAPDRCARRTLNTYSKNTFNRNTGSVGDAAADAPSPRPVTPKEKTERKPSPDENQNPCFFGATKESRNCDIEAVQPVAILARQRISRAQAEMPRGPVHSTTSGALVAPMLMLAETWKDGRSRILAECAAATQVSPAGAAKTDTHSPVKHSAPPTPSLTAGGTSQTIQNGP